MTCVALLQVLAARRKAGDARADVFVGSRYAGDNVGCRWAFAGVSH